MSRPGVLVHAAGASLGGLFIFAASTGEYFDREFTLFDDAMISMTYAKTLAETGVWNWYPGADSVQGFTNLGWTLWMAVLHLLPIGGSTIALIVSLTSLATIVGTALVVQRIVSLSIGADARIPLAPWLASSLVYLSFPLIYWSLRGMEVGLLTLILVSLLLLYMRIRTSNAGERLSLTLMFVVSFAGVWVRMDFAIVPIAIALVALLTFWKERNKTTLLVVASLVAGSLLGVATVMLFQFVTWGDPLPNTFYLKATGVSLLERVPRGVLASLKLFPAFLVLSLAAAALIRRLKWSVVSELALMACVVAFSLVAYSIYVGGDAWEDYLFANRYVTPALPLIALVLGLYLALMPPMSRKARWRLAIALPVTGIGMAVTANEPMQWWVLLLSVVVLLGLSVCFLATNSLAIKGKIFSAGGVLVASTVFVYFVTVSSIGLGSAIKWGGIQAASADAQMSNWGKELGEVTSEDAVIAVVWAGAPVYYSNRPAVDLLGKNDRRIAKMEPPLTEPGTWNEKFVPGHNKWDFDWSIATLKPDLIFQYVELSGEKEKIRKLGYVEYCLASGLPVQVLSQSNSVHRDLLAKCP